MPEREVWLTVPAPYLFELLEGAAGAEAARDLTQPLEFRLRCRMVYEGDATIIATVYGFEDIPGGELRRLPRPIIAARIPRDKVLRQEDAAAS